MKKLLILALLLASCIPYSVEDNIREPLPTASPVMTLSTKGQVYDCAGGSVGGFKVKADDVTIRNCTVNATVDYSFEVRANGLTVDNVKVYNNRTEGSIFDFVLPDGSCVSNTTISNVYADGDVGWGFTGRICGLDLSDSQFYRIGKKSNSGKHFFYMNHSTGITLRNVYIEGVENSCFKIVGNVSFIYFYGVTCKNIGMSGSYGSGLMIGEGGDNARSTDAHHLFLNGFQVINAKDGAVVIDDDRKPVYDVCINGVCYDELQDMKTLPPVQSGTVTPTRTPTKAPTITPTVVTPTRTPAPSVTPDCRPLMWGSESLGTLCK